MYNIYIYMYIYIHIYICICIYHILMCIYIYIHIYILIVLAAAEFAGQEVQIEPWAVRAANLRDQECQGHPGTSIGIYGGDLPSGYLT